VLDEPLGDTLANKDDKNIYESRSDDYIIVKYVMLYLLECEL
jgi:hypothetical protein